MHAAKLPPLRCTLHARATVLPMRAPRYGHQVPFSKHLSSRLHSPFPPMSALDAVLDIGTDSVVTKIVAKTGTQKRFRARDVECFDVYEKAPIVWKSNLIYV